MSLIQPQNLATFFTKLEARMWLAYMVPETFTSRIATMFTTGTEFFLQGWIGMVDGLIEWTGSRKVDDPAPQTYLVGVQNFEMTKSIDKFKLDDDLFGIYAPLVEFMGRNMKKWSDYQLRDLILNKGTQGGQRQKGTDLLNHWATNHPVDFYDATKGTYANDFRGGFTVNGKTVGGAFALNAFNSLWEEIASRKAENGEALGIVPDLSMSPPQLKASMSTVLQSQFIGAPVIGNLGTGTSGQPNAAMVGATDNVHRGWTDLLISPDFASAPDTWLMLVTNQAIKPFGWCLREAPTFAYRIAPNDPVVFDTHKYLYGVTARGMPLWSLPWLSAISGPS